MILTPALMDGTLHALAGQAAAFEALLLLASALHKAVSWSHLQAVVRQFGGVRPSLALPALAGVAVSEVAAGGLLLVPAWRIPGALLAAAIWTLYLLLIVRAILQGRRDADCGCSFGTTQRSLGAFQVARNAVLLLLAAAVALAGGRASDGGAQAEQLLAACALLALYGALDQVMGLRPLRSGEVS